MLRCGIIRAVTGLDLGAQAKKNRVGGAHAVRSLGRKRPCEGVRCNI